jgi:hypothetical protein
MIGDSARVSVTVAVPPPLAFEISIAGDAAASNFAKPAAAAGTLVTVTHHGLSALRSGHPARHGLQGADFSRMIGLWWGEQMSSLRQSCSARIIGRK